MCLLSFRASTFDRKAAGHFSQISASGGPPAGGVDEKPVVAAFRAAG